jgi:hypothetical protein
MNQWEDKRGIKHNSLLLPHFMIERILTASFLDRLTAIFLLVLASILMVGPMRLLTIFYCLTVLGADRVIGKRTYSS